jgi:hypothetical protein
MRICVLVDGHVQDIHPEPFLPGQDVEVHALRAPVLDQLRAQAEGGGFDVFLNLCEGYELSDIRPGGQGYRGIEVVLALEILGVPFTGAGSRGFRPTREEQQAAARAHGLRFVEGREVDTVEQAAEFASGMTYPVMVKHPEDRTGMTLHEASKAETLDQVKVEAARMIANFGAARVEEFVEGTEYNVLVVEEAEDPGRPAAYPPAGLVFVPGQGFRHTDLSWGSDMSFQIKEVTEPQLAASLQDLARRTYLALDLTGYARVDIRADESGQFTVLAIHPNPAIMSPGNEPGPADYLILFDKDGYQGFFDRVFAAAFARRPARRSDAVRSA